MQIIASHMNTDFDALASMIAAKKIYPHAQLVISNRQQTSVRQFLNIYRDMFDLVTDNRLDWSEVTDLILVDVASLRRVSQFTNKLNHESLHITVYDHHPRGKNDVREDVGVIEEVGATVTLLLEEINRKNLPITSFEATLFGLGIYTDTGFFTFKNTTDRDLQMASFLLRKGMNLDIIKRFSGQTLKPDQQKMLDHLFVQSTTYNIDGLEIVTSSCQHSEVKGGLSVVTEKLLDIKGSDAAIAVVGMKNDVIIVGRASSERISLLPLLKRWRGGGHKHAGSATIKRAVRKEIYQEVKEHLHVMLKPAITAREIMTSPVKTVLPETTMEKAGNLMYRYDHSGYPVVENEQLLGMITRRDLSKAIHHGLGHAPVKGYMSTDVITTSPDATLEEIQNIVIEHNIGRLPVVKNGDLIGIISRTDIIEAVHQDALLDDGGKPTNGSRFQNNIQTEMTEQLDREILSVLRDMGNVADQAAISIFLIGGIVRDIFLQRSNNDIDIVVEGNGIGFANMLQDQFGGDVVTHESFGTATWTHPNELKIDIASSRLEYYDRPASLPSVEISTLREDLDRRDFTINAMAICLNQDKFGKLIDPFSGQIDLYNKKVKVLHNLSFIEDPTRIFRAVRFELRFNFKMDDQTEKLAVHSIEKVSELSKDRIIAEMKLLFKENHPTKVIRRLYELKFWQQLGVSDDHRPTSCSHAKQLQVIENRYSFGEFGWFIYFIIPFYNQMNIEQAKEFAITKRDTQMLEEIVALTKLDWTEISRQGELHRLLRNFTGEAILFCLAKDKTSHSDFVIDYLQKRNSMSTHVTGSDLLQLGLQPGPAYSKIFLEVEVAILNEQISSKEEAIKWVQQFIAEDERSY